MVTCRVVGLGARVSRCAACEVGFPTLGIVDAEGGPGGPLERGRGDEWAFVRR
jgi:hypothetical protein